MKFKTAHPVRRIAAFALAVALALGALPGGWAEGLMSVYAAEVAPTVAGLTVSATPAEIEVGDVAEVTIQIDPGWTITDCEAQDADVVGLVRSSDTVYTATGLKAGKTTIVVKAAQDAGGDTTQATCDIKVNEPAPSGDLSLSKTSLSLTFGNKKTLTATPTGDAVGQQIEWSVTGEAVALPTVTTGESMEIEAVKPGDATVQVSCGGYTAQASVHVDKRTLSIVSILTADGQAPVYNGTERIEDLVVTLTDFVDDTARTENLLADAAADAKLTVGEQSVTLTYDDTAVLGENYLAPATGTVCVRPAQVTATVSCAAEGKPYDGTVNVPAALLSAGLEGVFSGDDLAATVTGGRFASAGVGEGIEISDYSVQLTGADQGNYTVTPTNPACVGSITKNDEPQAVTLLATMLSEDGDMTLCISATGAFDGKGLNGVATVRYTSGEESVQVNDGIGTLTLSGQAALDRLEITFRVAETEANYAGSFTATASYDPALPVQQVNIQTNFENGDAVTDGIVYGQTPRLQVEVTDGSVPVADPRLIFNSTDRGAATVDQDGVITVVDASKGSVTITVQAAGSANCNASQPVEVTIPLKKMAVTASITCAGKPYDGTDIAQVEGALDGLLPADEGLVSLANSGDGLTGTYAQSDVGRDIAVTADGLTLTGTLGGNVPAANNYKLSAASASCTADITPADLSAAQLVLTTDADDGKTMYYTGQACEPAVTVTMDLDGDGVYETTLAAPGDYTVRYENNTARTDAAKVTVSGAGNYENGKDASFTIAYRPAPDDVIALSGNNGGVAAEKVLYGGNNSGSSETIRWYNSAVTLTAAQGYGISGTEPAPDATPEQTLVLDAETTDALAASQELYVQELSSGAISQVRILDVIAIDLTAPVLKAVQVPAGNAVESGGVTREYHKEAFTVTWTVEEANYASAQVEAGADTTVPPLATVSSNTDDAAAITVTVDPNGAQIDGEEYVPSLTVTDAAGNVLVLDASLSGETVTCEEGTARLARPHVLDNVAPVLAVNAAADAQGTAYYQASLQEENYSVSANEPYRSEKQAVMTLAATDGSPVRIAYKVTSSVAAQSGEKLLEGDYALNASAQLQFTGEQRFILETLAVEDAAGNRSSAGSATASAGNYIYLDATAPEVDELAPLVSLVATESGQGQSTAGVPLYNDTVQIQADLRDPYFGGSDTGAVSSGLYALHYKVTRKGQTMSLDAGAVASDAGTADGQSVSYAAETVGEDSIVFTFDRQAFNYNDVTLTVWAEDWAGNKSGEVSYTFGIDITVPRITVSYDNNDAQNEKYFKEDRTATVTVYERNFDPNATEIRTQAAASVSGWTHAEGAADNGDEDTWTCQVRFTVDGEYTFGVSAKDLVGHDAGAADYGNSVAPQDFVLDKTVPIIEVRFDNNDVRNERYYDRARVATITIIDRNFSAEYAQVTVDASIAEGTVTAPGVEGWNVGGEQTTGTVRFAADGDYGMSVEFVDLAGNEAQALQVDGFTVDTTPPTLEIGGVEDRSANQGEVAPSITYHDINYDPSMTSVTITGYKNTEGSNLAGVTREDAMGGSYVCENIEPIPENDDVYLCVGHVEDLAGNVSEQQIRFSVNRFGSNYILSDETQALVDNYYTNQRPTLQVTEINVDTLEFMEITASSGGAVDTLEQGKDYTVEQKGDENTWKEYTYTIAPENFEADGAYNITIFSRDAAENENSNRTTRQEYAKPIDFALDTTPPTAVITGVDNDETYFENGRTVTIYAEDNIRLGSLQLFMDGELIAEYDEEQLEASDGVVTYEARSGSRWQELGVTVTDRAGNTLSDMTVRYLLTRNLFVQYINSTPALVISLVAAAAAAGFIIILLRRKKKEKETV